MENSINFFLKKYSYVIGIVVFLLFYFLFLSSPGNFPVGSIINISEGASLHSLSLELANAHLIRSRVAFEAFVILYGGEKHIIPADYLFESGEPVFTVASRIVRGERHLAPVTLTIPEGFNVSDIASVASAKLANFNKNKFLIGAKGKEGYLFPDTYFFFTTDDENVVLRVMSDNFNKKVAPLFPAMAEENKKESDIITMASLVEREAKGDADRAVISGILWHRLALGMALQVDAAPETYKTRGLPKNPICNPGLEAIDATIYPKVSPYLYYLHDKDGDIHYAKTFLEHMQNKFKYLPPKADQP